MGAATAPYFVPVGRKMQYLSVGVPELIELYDKTLQHVWVLFWGYTSLRTSLWKRDALVWGTYNVLTQSPQPIVIHGIRWIRCRLLIRTEMLSYIMRYLGDSISWCRESFLINGNCLLLRYFFKPMKQKITQGIYVEISRKMKICWIEQVDAVVDLRSNFKIVAFKNRNTKSTTPID